MIEYKDLPDYAYGYAKKNKKTVIIMKDTGEIIPCKAEDIPPMGSQAPTGNLYR